MRHFKIKILLLSLLWIILAVIFGIYDLQISMNIANQNSVWAKFLENFGMIPGLLVILSGIYIYYSFIKNKSDVWSYIQKVVFILVGSGLVFHLFDILFDNAASNQLVAFLIISVTINLILFIIIHKIQQVKSEAVIKYSKVVLAVALFGYVICIQVVKYIWGRVRFRELDAAFSQFTPWYLPQGITGSDSFPSGHAAMGWMLLPLLILLVNKKAWFTYASTILIFIWAVVLASSRVVIGAHYASDVLFGSFFIIMKSILFNRKFQTGSSK
jgi:membrane-associated phospholipid phosphatase